LASLQLYGFATAFGAAVYFIFYFFNFSGEVDTTGAGFGVGTMSARVHFSCGPVSNNAVTASASVTVMTLTSRAHAEIKQKPLRKMAVPQVVRV